MSELERARIDSPAQAAAETPWPWKANSLKLAAILLVGLVLRTRDLGRTSLWFDETNSMRVARTANLGELIARLDQVDGSRAVLHPVVLQLWLRVFGPSDVAGRALSVCCGLITVALIYLLGRQQFDEATGLWGAWLAAVCPPLVYYSRETRMYAWLVMLTCLSWLAFFGFRSSSKLIQSVVYGLLLIFLVYSHPLGLFMVAAHGVTYLLVRHDLALRLRSWLVIQLAVIAGIAPWLPRYLDHGTDYPLPRYSIRYLLAVPIEYVGGNSLVLIACMAIIGYGLIGRRSRDRPMGLSLVKPFENVVFLTWTVVPPLFMYLFSAYSQPIFGPARYHLFIAPAYLILLAHGLAKVPALIRWPAAAAGLFLSLTLIQADVYTIGLKADWRGLAAWLDQYPSAGGAGPLGPVTIVVHPSDPRFPHDEAGAARYYLSPRHRVVIAGESTAEPNESTPRAIYHAYCVTRPRASGTSEPDAIALYGLDVKRDHGP